MVEAAARHHLSMAAKPLMRSFVLDCPDTLALARFYADLLGLEVREDSTEEWAVVALPSGVRLAFQHSPDHVAPQWPEGAVQQQAHVDLTAVDLDPSHQRVLELGAVLGDPDDSREKAVEQGFRVYLDPAGHPFCLCQDDESPWA